MRINFHQSYRLLEKRWQSSTTFVRLNKRISELNLCSRREADRLIRQGKVKVNGVVANLGEKVSFDLSANQIEFIHEDDDNTTTVQAVVLNKPLGFVSGQAEHGHAPAIRLLSQDRLWDSDFDNYKQLPSSWKGYAPAGRLDLNSTGLLVFSSSGILAKKIIHHDSKVEKEYIVDVVPAQQITKRERQIDEHFELPDTTMDLSRLRQGGGTLLGDTRQLLPCAEAEWIDEGKRLRIVLTEGRKHHIRRVCRELLGYHVVQLQRIRIGPILLGDLPQGCWRPLIKDEWNVLLNN